MAHVDTEPSAPARPRLARDTFNITEPPDKDSDEFKELIGSSERILKTINVSEDILSSIPEQADEISRNLISYTSFGDEGATASVSSAGDILQITRFLGTGRSGFFSVNVNISPEPYLVKERAEQLGTMSDETFGIDFCYEQSEGIPTELLTTLAQPAKPEFVRNRWPRFTKDSEDLTWVVQNYTRNNIVFIRSLAQAKINPISILSEDLTSVFIPQGYLIREQEFIDSNYKFNEEEWEDSDNYTHFLGPHCRSIIVAHRGIKKGGRERLGESAPDTVALIVAVCVNGQVCELERTGDDDISMYRIKLPKGGTLTTTPSKSVEVTTACRLQLMSNEVDWTDCVIPVSEFMYLDTEFQDKPEPFRNIPFSLSDPHLDYIIRRNLEHILSVCSILLTPKLEEEETAIALTCGDMSGHRIITSASFFAFEFLLAISNHVKKFQSEEDHPECDCRDDGAGRDDRAVCMESARTLYQRIEKTCRRHLNWIKQAQREDASFAANYWASGEEIAFADSDYHTRAVLGPPSLTDTPFQILKVANFARRFHTKENKDLAFNLLTPWVRRWIENLKADNSRGFFAFPRPSGSGPAGVKYYRLEDHVWIWRALHSLHEIGLEPDPRKTQNSKDKARRGRDKDPTPHFSAAQFQTQILSRFTTENNTSRQRMLAVGRSALSNRFMFRSRDTALFYEENAPIFRKVQGLWSATIDAQRFHEENEDSRWGNPLRYGLALMMGSQDLSINSKPADRMLKVAKKTLFQSSGPNGLLPGQLNSETNEPEIYHDDSWRDFFWHASFELPFILWKYMIEKLDIVEESHQEAAAQEPTAGQPEFKMKKSMPLNNLIDERSIVEIPDMWLYNSPDFFDREPKMTEKFQSLTRAPESYISNARGSLFTADGHVLGNSSDPDIGIARGILIDVPKTQHTGGQRKKNKNRDAPDFYVLHRNFHILYRLQEHRTPENAKKRLIWLPNPDPDTGLLCVLGSSNVEAPYVSSFFDRHMQRMVYFFDEATATANLWKTELHLSSYQVGDNPQKGDMKFLGNDTKVLRRGAMGFRFVGDFFDRYWTCHVLEYDPKEDWSLRSAEPQMMNDFRELIMPKRLHEVELEKRPWRQRKVLELMLLDRMLEKIVGRYKQILKQTGIQLTRLFPRAGSAQSQSDYEDVVMVSNALFSTQLDSDNYLVLSQIWPAFQYTLQVLEEDVAEILEKLHLWNNREKERQPERPRWTNHDETKYRAAINKLTISNSHRVRELERYQAQIQSLRTRLESRLEATRNELSFQSAVDVQVFTYVTAVFLPLGFATGIFSMNGSPGGTTLKAMVVTAIVTLALTLFLTINTRRITYLYRKFSKSVTNVFEKDTSSPSTAGNGGSAARNQKSENPMVRNDRHGDGSGDGGGGGGGGRDRNREEDTNGNPGRDKGETSRGVINPSKSTPGPFWVDFAGLFRQKEKGADENQVDGSKLEKGRVDSK